MTSQSFSNVTPERWADIKTVFSNETGLSITTDASAESVTFKGVKFEWKYLRGTDVLVVTVDGETLIDKAAGYNDAKVMSMFAAWIDGVA